MKTVNPLSTALETSSIKGLDMTSKHIQDLLSSLVRAGMTLQEAEMTVQKAHSTGGKAALIRLAAINKAIEEAQLAIQTEQLVQLFDESAFWSSDSLAAHNAFHQTLTLTDSLTPEQISEVQSQALQLETTWSQDPSWLQSVQQVQTLSAIDPIALLAQAGGGALATATGSAGAATATAATTTAAAGLSTGAILAGVGLVALAAGGGGGSGGESPPSDTTAPTLTITDDEDGIVNIAGGDITYTFTFSEAVTGFTDADITVANAAKGTFTPVSSTVYTLVVTPTAGFEGNVTVNVAAGVAADLAGNNNTAAASNVQAVDMLAPEIRAEDPMTVTRGTKTIEIHLTETAQGTPSKDQFAVTTMKDGQPEANAVAELTVNGSVIKLVLTKDFDPGVVNLTYTSPTTGGVTDAAANPLGSFFSGVAADGYIRGAKVLIETTVNGTKQTQDTGIVTDANGQFFLPTSLAQSGTIVIRGGVNIDTGIPNTVDMKAPAGSSSVNPLTTMVQSVIDNAPADAPITAADAGRKVATALGFGSEIDLLNFDPLSAVASIFEAKKTATGTALDDLNTAGGLALSAQKTAAKVVAIASLISDSAADADKAEVIANVFKAVAQKISDTPSTAPLLDLNDTTTLTSIVDSVQVTSGSLTAEAIQTNVTAAVSGINSATDLVSIAAQQSLFLDRTPPKAAVIELVSALTNDNTPSITVKFDTRSTDGSAAIAGDMLRLFNGTTEVASRPLNAADIKAGQFVFELAIELEDGPASLTAKLTDAGNNSSTSTPASLTVDTVTAQPTIDLVATDDKVNATEKTAGITVSGAAEANASVAVSIGSGAAKTVQANDQGKWTTTFSSTELPVSGTTTVRAVATDLAGNVSDAGTKSITIDTVAPTLGSSTPNDNATGFSGKTVVLTFNEPVKAGTGKIVINGGATPIEIDVSTSNVVFSGNTVTITAPLQPSADYHITLAPGVILDSAGNPYAGITDPEVLNFGMASNPTVSIQSSQNLLGIGGSSEITFTLSEAPKSGTSFSIDDIEVTGGAGTLDALIEVSETVYKATFTPEPNLAAGTASIAVKDSAFEGAESGLVSVASSSPTLVVDTVAPSISITSDKAQLKAGETATITFTFSEDPGNSFTADDVTITNGAIGAISGTGLTRTATFTPTPNLASGTTSISVAASSYTDAASNAGSAGNSPSISIDTLPPTLTITDDEDGIGNIAGGDITYTFTFSEAVTGFTADDITVANGAKGTFTTVSPTTYTLVVTPTAGVEGNVTVNVAAGAAADAAENDTAATQNSQTVDMRAPVVESVIESTAAAVTNDAVTFTVTFSEALTGTVSTESFTATNGAITSVTQVGTSNAYSVVVTPNANVASGNVALSLVGTGLTDAAGNALANANLSSLASQAIDTVAPVVTTVTEATTAAVTKDAITFTVTFSEALTGTVSTESFTATNGAITSVTQVGTSNAYSVVVTPNANVASGNVALSLVGTGLTDAAGNALANANLSSLASQAIDTVAPVVTTVTEATTAAVTKDTITFTVTFSEALTGTVSTESFTATNGAITSVTQVGTSNAYSVVVTPNANVASGNVALSLVGTGLTDAAGNALANANLSSLASQAIDTVVPGLASVNGVQLNLGSDNLLNKDDTLIVKFSEPVRFLSATEGLALLPPSSLTPVNLGTDFSLSPVNSNNTPFASEYQLTFGSNPSLPAGSRVSIGANRFIDAAGNANSTAIDVVIPITVNLDVPWMLRDMVGVDELAIAVAPVVGDSIYKYSIDFTRFGTAAYSINNASSGNKVLIVDLPTQEIFGQIALAANEQVIFNGDQSTLLYTASLSGTSLSFKTYDIGLSAKGNIEPTDIIIPSITLPASTNLDQIHHVVLNSDGNIAYLTGFTNSPTVWQVSDNTAVPISLPTGFSFIGRESFINSSNELVVMLGKSEIDQSFFKLKNNIWSPIGDDEYWNNSNSNVIRYGEGFFDITDAFSGLKITEIYIDQSIDFGKEGTLHVVEIETGDKSAGFTSLILARTSQAGKPEFLRADLPIGSYLPPFYENFQIQTLNLTTKDNSPLNADTLISNVSQNQEIAVKLYEPTVVEMIKAIEIANEFNKIFDFSGLTSTVFTKDQLAGGIANPNSVYGLERQSNYEASDASADPNIFNLLFVQELNFSNDKFSVKTIINVYKENELINTTSVEGYLDEFAIKQSSRNTPEIFLMVSVESHAIESDDFSFHYDPLTGILTPITNSDFDAIIDSDDDFLPSGMGSRLADTINGSADDDILYGFGGNDKITSGIGNDTIFGGQGADTIILSTGGVDVIGYNSASEGNDTLVGFDPEDKIDLSQLIYGFSDFSFKQFTNEPQVFEISNVRINSSKSRVSADIIIGPDSSLFNTSEKIREAIITFEFDNSKSTLEFTDSSISLDEDNIPFIVANTDIRIIEPEGGFVPMIFSGKVEKPSISDISSGTKLLQVNFTPKAGFTVDDIQVSMTQAFIGAETIDGTVIEIFPKLPNPVKSNGTEVNQSSTIDGLLVIGMDTDESSAIGDNEMRIYQDLSDDGLLKIRFDTDPSVGKEDIATLLVYGIKNPLDTDNFVLQIF